MHFVGPTEDETIAALEQLKKTIRIAFCGVMQSTQLPPMGCASRRQPVPLRLGAAQRRRFGSAANLARALGGAASRRFSRNPGLRQRVAIASLVGGALSPFVFYHSRLILTSEL
jgi:hypothetical protein